jgi:Homeodomain-like domain
MAQAGLQLKPHLSRAALRRRYRKCKDAKEARRWHALWLMSEGASTQEAAAAVGFASSWVRRPLAGGR